MTRERLWEGGVFSLRRPFSSWNAFQCWYPLVMQAARGLFRRAGLRKIHGYRDFPGGTRPARGQVGYDEWRNSPAENGLME
jgi:hypothetical protein